MSKKTIITLVGIAVAIVLIILVTVSKKPLAPESLIDDTNTSLETSETDTVPTDEPNQTPSSSMQTNTPSQTPTSNTSAPTPETTKIIMNTNLGEISLELFDTLAPKTVENFTKLAQDGFYNGTRFHRVIPDFMIQGGDPLSTSLANKDRWGTGGPGYQFADEIHAENRNEVGTISMANAGPNTNGSQFFINTANNSFLDTKHTVFGRVTSGMDVVASIEGQETDQTDKPLKDVIINSIQIL